MAYLNVGGIGMLFGPAVQVALDEFPHLEALRLVAAYGDAEVRRVEAPAGGWTADTLTRELDAGRHYADSFAPVNAFVGQHWLGSTEV